MWSGLEGMMYRRSLEQIQSRGGGDDSKRDAENIEKGNFCVYVLATLWWRCLVCVVTPQASSASLWYSAKETVSNWDRTGVSVGVGRCLPEAFCALLCSWVGRGREGHSDKLSSHFVFTQLAFVCKMPVALFSASRNTLFDPVVAGACTNLWSSQTVERLIYHYTTRKLPHHVETYLELVIRKGSWLSKSFSQVRQTFNYAWNARFPILVSRCYFRIVLVAFMAQKVTLPIYFQVPPSPRWRQARPACKMS